MPLARNRVLELAQARMIDAILVTELSRWGRSTQGLLDTLYRLAGRKGSVVAMTRAPATAIKPLGSFRLCSFDPCVGCTTERPGTVRGEQDRAREAPGRRFWNWRSGGFRCPWRKSDGERRGGCEDGTVRLGRKGWRPEEQLQ